VVKAVSVQDNLILEKRTMNHPPLVVDRSCSVPFGPVIGS
jgi:hypothetical protein